MQTLESAIDAKPNVAAEPETSSNLGVVGAAAAVKVGPDHDLVSSRAKAGAYIGSKDVPLKDPDEAVETEVKPKDTPTNSASKRPTPKFSIDDLYYDMSGDKFMIIFNHYKFQCSRYFRFEEPTRRIGTYEDVKSIKNTFEKLGFKVITHDDLVFEDIMQVVYSLVRQDHQKTSCVCVAFLTHGHKGDLYAADRPYQFSDVTTLFEGTNTLTGKPKIFFIQACRGNKADSGSLIEVDSAVKETITLPSYSDVLVLRSSVLGYVSFRDVKGSWMIQELCRLINETSNYLDILQILTLLNRNIAYFRSSYSRNKDINNKKQMPEVTYTLTKFLRFDNKKLDATDNKE